MKVFSIVRRKNIYEKINIYVKKNIYIYAHGLPGGSVVKNLLANAGRCKFDPWFRKMSWRRKW